MEENRTTIEHPEFEADEAKDRKDIRFDPVLYEKVLYLLSLLPV